MGDADIVWFMGPVNGPGHYLLVSDRPGISRRPEKRSDDPPDVNHRPPNFAWKSMDRKWHDSGMPQGYTAMNWRGIKDMGVSGRESGWSVLSVTDYTQDSRRNVMVSFAVHRMKVQEPEMRCLADERFPYIWKRLGVREELWSPDELRR